MTEAAAILHGATAQSLVDSAKSALDVVPEGPARELLRELADEAVRRQA
jgi:geranylgeranyl pyrophosphate synthase